MDKTQTVILILLLVSVLFSLVSIIVNLSFSGSEFSSYRSFAAGDQRGQIALYVEGNGDISNEGG